MSTILETAPSQASTLNTRQADRSLASRPNNLTLLMRLSRAQLGEQLCHTYFSINFAVLLHIHTFRKRFVL